MKTSIKLLLVCLILFLSYPLAAISQTCCWRNVGTEIAFPYDVNSQIYNDMGYIGTESGWDEVFVSFEHGGGPLLKCPQIDIIEMNPIKPLPIAPKLDYKFSGRYTVIGDGSPPRGYSVTLSVDLIDVGRGATVKRGTSSWTCVPREAGYCLRMRIEKTQALAKTFQPLDKIIYDYERIPETVAFKLEKEPVLAGEKMKITLTDIKDINAKPSQSWQRILIKAEKGKILNGEPYQEFRVFRVGNGKVEIEYKAPDICKSDVETITVLNSCSIRPDLPPYPERKIAEKKFEIFCVEGKIKITIDLTPWHIISGLLQDEECQYKGGPIKKEPGYLIFRLRPTKDPCIYEVEEKDSIPSIYEERYIPVDTEHCCIFSYREERMFKFSGKPVVNFNKSLNKPFFLTIDNSGKSIINCPPAPPITQSFPWGEGSQGYPSWPLKNGYVDDIIKSMKYELIIDDKEVEKLIKRCTKKR